jgi:hypothetical protein
VKEPDSRRVRVWKIISTALVFFALIGGVVTYWIESIATRRRAEMERFVRELHAETLARAGSRPVLRGEAVPGNAWEDYSRALATIEILRRGSDESAIQTFWREFPEADPIKVRALVGSHATIFDDLSRGAQRTFHVAPDRWEEGLARRNPYFTYTCEVLAQFAACRARLLARDGKTLEAIRIMLDLLQFGRDMASNAERQIGAVSEAVCTISLLELRDLFFSNGLSREDLLGFEKEMESVDRHFPSVAPILTNAALSLGFELLKSEDARISDVQVPLRLYWRYAFSRRIADAEAYRRVIALAKKGTAVQGQSRTEAIEFMHRLRNEASILAHPLMERGWEIGLEVDATTRCTLARLRLLRVAVHYRATGEILELEDPEGKLLLHSMNGTRLRVWSVWKNGVDDQGDDAGVGWLKRWPFMGQGKPIPYPRDIVLEVQR